MGQLIVLCGERGVGKDFLTSSVAEHMAKRGINVTRLSFSDEVRRVAYVLFPFLKDVLNENKNDPILGEENNPKGYAWRDIIKMVGKVCRDVDSAYFAKRWSENQSHQVHNSSSDDLFFITDMRTQDEYDLLLATSHTFDNIKFVKIVSETGLQPDDFEKWTREFNQQDILFENLRDEESVNLFIDALSLDVRPTVRVNSKMMNSILNIQNQNNALYLGTEEWREKADLVKYCAAAEREFSEFLDEITSDWAWWKKGEQHFDINKAMVEFCDYVCFKMSVFLIKHPDDWKIQNPDIRRQVFTNVDFSNWYRTIKTQGMVYLQNAPSYARMDYLSLVEEINITLDYFNIKAEQFYNTMQQVLERNSERAEKISQGLLVNKAAEQTITTVEE